MKRQTVLRKPLRQNFEYSLRIFLVLEAQQTIIGIADLERLPSQAWFHLYLEPHIEHMMKVDIGQQWAADLPLTGPRLHREESSVVHHPDVDPLIDLPISLRMLASLTLRSTIFMSCLRTIESK